MDTSFRAVCIFKLAKLVYETFAPLIAPIIRAMLHRSISDNHLYTIDNLTKYFRY